MPRKKQAPTSVTNDPVPQIAQVGASDPTLADLDTAIQSWTDLINVAIPNVFNTLNYLRGIIDTL